MAIKNKTTFYNPFMILIITVIITVIIIVLSASIYGYNSGSCKINKKKQVVCTNKFCLYKEFQINLNKNLKNSNIRIVRRVKHLHSHNLYMQHFHN